MGPLTATEVEVFFKIWELNILVADSHFSNDLFLHYGVLLLCPNGREYLGANLPNATRPFVRLHWATIVAHYRALAAFAAYVKKTLGN